MNFLKCLLLIVIGLATLAVCVLGQNNKSEKTPPAPFQRRTNVHVVNIRGDLVNDLKISDIKIFEDEVEQKVTSFSRKDVGLDLALVVDNSGSLRTQFPIVQAVAKTLIGSLVPGDRVTVIRFISSDKIEIFEPWTSDKKVATASIDRMYIEGGASAVLDAVFLAGEDLKKQQGSGGSKHFAAVVISDFEDRMSYYSLDQALKPIAGTDIQIFPFALTQDLASTKKANAAKLAHTLAVLTGGNASILDKNVSKDLLVEKLTKLVKELRSQYVVGYTPTNQKRDTSRRVRVEILDGPQGEKRIGNTSESYFLPTQ
jgi:Ca-activated chloride channel family protein